MELYDQKKQCSISSPYATLTEHRKVKKVSETHIPSFFIYLSCGSLFNVREVEKVKY